MVPRRTIERPASVKGIGLHTGCRTTVTCHPAEVGHGIVFRRTDLFGAQPIPARLSEVSVTERRTGLGTGASTIHTVEHLLAAVGAWRLDDLLIEIDGPEPPIVDGSFKPYMDLLTEAGPVDHGGDAVVYRITEPFGKPEKKLLYRLRVEEDHRDALRNHIDFLIKNPPPFLFVQDNYSYVPVSFVEIDTIRVDFSVSMLRDQSPSFVPEIH